MMIDITPEKDEGVLKEIIKDGEGDEHPGAGCSVLILYQGTLVDGSVFDSNKEFGRPFEFKLGSGSVIKVWDLGVATMKKGEIAKLICKPEYTCSERETSLEVPKNMVLVFEITLLSWKAEDISQEKDDGILKTIITKGEAYITPNEGSLVKIHITGKHEGKVFEDRDVDFDLGTGSEHGIVEGIEKALNKFEKGEKSSLEIKPQYAFREIGHEELNIPPNATIHYTVELKDFQQGNESYMDTAEKIESQARKRRLVREVEDDESQSTTSSLKIALKKMKIDKAKSEAEADVDVDISQAEAGPKVEVSNEKIMEILNKILEEIADMRKRMQHIENRLKKVEMCLGLR